MSDIYPYADENRLAQPHSYMYPPLHGVAFFPAYKASRCAAIDILLAGGIQKKCGLPLGVAHVAKEACSMSDHVTLMPPLSLRTALYDMIAAIEEGTSLVPPPIDVRQETRVRTATVLNALLKAAPEQNGGALAWTAFFLGRFEITKRLYTEYVLPSRKGNGKYDSYGLYIRLALLFGTICFCKEDLRALNALLKLNDLLCSIAKVLRGKEASMACCAIILETACATKLLHRIRDRNARS